LDGGLAENNTPSNHDDIFALYIAAGAHATVTESKLTNFSIAIKLSQSDSQINVKHCEILCCKQVMQVSDHSNASFSECILGAEEVVFLHSHARGVIEFKRNTMINHPVIGCDSTSKLPKHDFNNPTLMSIVYKAPSACASSKEQSEFTKQQQPMMKKILSTARCVACPSSMKDVTEIMNDNLYKRCKRCSSAEDIHGLIRSSSKGIKFKYCSRCQKVCYCSKECQNSDWKDHKFICKP
jgi:hypothetical protein